MSHGFVMPPRAVALALGGWLVVAAVAVGAGLLQGVPAPALPAAAAVLTLAVLGAWRAVPTLHTWLRRVNLRVLVLFHLTRFVGIYFLVEEAAGRLPTAWAVPAGWGDTAVATIALGLGLLADRLGTARRPMLFLWNALGLADVLYVVASGARLAMADPPAMAALRELPLGLLPTFLVPLIIATHVIMLVRLGGTVGAESG